MTKDLMWDKIRGVPVNSRFSFYSAIKITNLAGFHDSVMLTQVIMVMGLGTSALKCINYSSILSFCCSTYYVCIILIHY